MFPDFGRSYSRIGFFTFLDEYLANDDFCRVFNCIDLYLWEYVDCLKPRLQSNI